MITPHCFLSTHLQKTKGFTIISSINMVFFQQKSLPLSTHSTIKTAIASALYTNKYGLTKNSN
ncbi:hypothetical protein FMM78_00145 [Bacteroides caecimuris]|nr:hypothetical protein [Bacteroides caecimuris]